MKFPKLEQTAAALISLAGAILFAGGAIAMSLPGGGDQGALCMYAGAIVGLFGLFALWRAESDGL